MKMKRRLRTFAVLAALLASWIGAGATVQTPQPAAVMPFERVNGFILLNVKVDDVPSLMILDSGSELSAVDPALAAQLKDPSFKEIETLTPNGVMKSRRMNASIEAGDIPSSPQFVGVVDLSGLSVQRTRFVRGLLGTDWMRQWIVEIDHDAKAIRLWEPKGFTAPSGFSPVGATPDGSLFAVPIEFGRRGTVLAMVDLGDSNNITLSPQAARRLGVDQIQPSSTTASRNLGGVQEYRIVTAQDVSFGGRPLPPVPVRIAAQLGFDARVGIGVLSRFHLFFDLGNNRLWLSPAAGASAPFRKNLLGYGQQDGVVMMVASGGPAEAAGLKLGDRILSVNGARPGDRDTDAQPIVEGEAFTLVLDDGRSIVLKARVHY